MVDLRSVLLGLGEGGGWPWFLTGFGEGMLREVRCDVLGEGGGGVETKGLWEMREKSFRDNNVANQKSHLL